MESVKNCTNCEKHVGKKTIDDVHKDCYECVSLEKTLGYYPNWEPVNGLLEHIFLKKLEALESTDEEEEEWMRKEIKMTVIKDNVNSPQHYTQGGIETIDFIKAKLGKDGTIAYCIGNSMKYLSRWKDKGGLEDLKKSRWYQDYAINLMESS